MRILGIERDSFACNHYRIVQPLTKMKLQGLAECATIYQNELQEEFAQKMAMESDIILIQKPWDKRWFDFIKLCQKHGKIIVVDFDDDPFNTHPMNPFYKLSGVENAIYEWSDGTKEMLWQDGQEGFSIERNIEWQDMFRACFRKADLITSTTKILADEFGKINTSSIDLPNLMDFSLFRRYDIKKKEIRIGYQGGQSHYPDIFMIKDAVSNVVRANPNVKFVFAGDYRHVPLWQDIPTSQFEFHRWEAFSSYPYKLPLLNLDIGLCPLVDNRFNRCKSSLKWLDYTSVGAATIASDIPPYSIDILDGQTGLLIPPSKKQEEITRDWTDAIQRLVSDKRIRNRLKKKAYSNAYENYNADKKAYLWRDAYEKILKQEVTV